MHKCASMLPQLLVLRPFNKKEILKAEPRGFLFYVYLRSEQRIVLASM
jgi:hypothetical protein